METRSALRWAANMRGGAGISSAGAGAACVSRLFSSFSGARFVSMEIGGGSGPGASAGAAESASAGGAVPTRLHLQKLPRSEEHTSELQSHVNLVCRLLLEKKKSMYR